MSWVLDNLERAKKIAADRENLHLCHKSHRPLSPGYEVIGVLGEIKFGQITGFSVDESRKICGDNGIDFLSPAGPIDVKTAKKAYHLIIEAGKVKDIIYVLAEISHDDVYMIGWEYGEEMKKTTIKDFGYGVLNHFVHRSKLKKMEELYKLILQQKPEPEKPRVKPLQLSLF